MTLGLARAALLVGLHAGLASAQSTPESGAYTEAGFIAEARSGTERYHDRAVAVADGFRRIGVDFPAMGEHWVSLQRVLDDTFDIARPSVLTYIMVDGKPLLAGVGYTALLEPGELPPDLGPAKEFWHEHNGSVVEESLPHHHVPAGRAAAGAVQPARRVSILHAWVWVDNPAGVFVTDNWALPARRLGVGPEQLQSPAARHVVTLGLGATPYYTLLLRDAVSPSAAEEAVISRVLEERRSRIHQHLGPIRLSGVLGVEESARLELQWSELWKELKLGLPQHAEALDATRGQLMVPEGRLAVD